MSKSMKISLMMVSITLGLSVLWLGYFVYFAVQQMEPVVDKAYFENGRSYASRYDSLQRGRDASLYVESNVVEGRAYTSGAIRAHFKIKGSVPIHKASGRLTVERTATTSGRLIFPISEEEFFVDLDLSKGAWDLKVDYDVNDDMSVHRNIRIGIY